MRHLFLLVCTVFSVVLADTYIQQNYTARPLTRIENEQLQETCGRKPYLTSSEGLSMNQQKVMNGRRVERNEAPWVVSLVRATMWKPSMTVPEIYKASYSGCTGSLISSRHVIIAAHCIYKSLNRLLFVFNRKCKDVRSNECREEPILIRKSLKAYRSVRFQAEGVNAADAGKIPREYADVGIYELTEDVPFENDVHPVCLGDYKVNIGESLDLYGYGRNGRDSQQKENYFLNHLPLTRVACSHQGRFMNSFCAYTQYQKSCPGDSGSGVIHTRKGIKSIVGVLSGGQGGCAAELVFGKEPYYDRVGGLLPHLYWICEATGVCPNKEVEKDVAIWNALPNRHRVRYQTFDVLDEYDIYI